MLPPWTAWRKKMDDETIRSRLRYDPESGNLFWLESGNKRWDSRRAGTIAGCPYEHRKSGKAYIVIRIGKSKSYLAHRIAFFLMTGKWPHLIDHANGNGCDNRWVNISDADRNVNARNAMLQSRNDTGIPGVYLRGGRFRVIAKSEGKAKGLGTFTNIFDAACAKKSFELANGYSAGHGSRRPRYGIREAIEACGLKVKV